MLIKINTDECKFTLPLPNRLFLNNFVARIVAKFINKSNLQFQLSESQLSLFCSELRRSKKALKNLPLVDVSSSTGERVIIRL